ncbi:hypothetical protein A0J61_09494 [Choanephora cucurbitarum]|uniref:Uncharacterized protein n=1 Tax=Choanephora cucurbitarum TaxID=101091 RepID=A0A1C7N052_9FUNG|nr:hypothetical protein A0J61_09494 [Choanephora cucurbitarum]
MVGFYNSLYNLAHTHLNDTYELLTSLQGRLSPAQTTTLMQSTSWDEIIFVSQRSPRKSSPGLDGLPYEILDILIRVPCFHGLILTSQPVRFGSCYRC